MADKKKLGIWALAFAGLAWLPLVAVAQVEVSVAAIDSEASELGSDTATFRFSRTGSTTSSLNVDLDFDGSTTVIPQDYSDNNGGQFEALGRVTIPAGQSQFDLVITPTADNLVEGEERLDITLAAGSYNIGSPSSAGIVITDDPPVVSLTALSVSASETGTTATFRFQRTGGALNQSLQVNVDFDGSTTVIPQDYSDNNGGQFEALGRVTIPAGQSQFDLVITPTADNLVEGEERLDITLAAGSYNIGSPSSAGIVIADDPPVVSVNVIEPVGEEGGAPAIIRFTRSGGLIAQSLDVDTTLDPASTATPTDFSDNNGGAFRAFGRVTILAGQSSFDLLLSPVQDNVIDEEEILIVDLDTGSYVVGDPMTAAVMFIEAPIFIDGFELQTVEKSACAIAAIGARELHRFHFQGASILDTETGVEWLRCGATKLYDWIEARCAKPSTDKGLSRATDREAQLEGLNRGLTGDNLGFSDWRWATVDEVEALQLQAQHCVVRESK